MSIPGYGPTATKSSPRLDVLVMYTEHYQTPGCILSHLMVTKYLVVSSDNVTFIGSQR